MQVLIYWKNKGTPDPKSDKSIKSQQIGYYSLPYI